MNIKLLLMMTLVGIGHHASASTLYCNVKYSIQNSITDLSEETLYEFVEEVPEGTTVPMNCKLDECSLDLSYGESTFRATVLPNADKTWEVYISGYKPYAGARNPRAEIGDKMSELVIGYYNLSQNLMKYEVTPGNVIDAKRVVSLDARVNCKTN